MNNVERYYFNQEKETLSNLEKYWIDNNIIWNEFLQRYQTEDGRLFLDKETAIEHETLRYLTGWYED